MILKLLKNNQYQIIQRPGIWFLPLLLVSALLNWQCNKPHSPDCLKLLGPTDTYERTFEPYNLIEVHDVFDIIIVQDSVHKIVVSGGQNIIHDISLQQTDTLLQIKSLSKCNWIRGYKDVVTLHLHLQNLTEMQIYGQINLYTADTLKGNYIRFRNWSRASRMDVTVNCYLVQLNTPFGTGDFRLSGHAVHNFIAHGGNGYVHAEGLQAQYGNIENFSTGDVKVQITHEMEAWVRGRGNIIYSGNPPSVIVHEASGIGRVIRK